MAKAKTWKNLKLKKLKNWIAKGSYNVRRGDRHLVLTNIKSGATRVYESHEAAKKCGWVTT